MVYQEDKKRLVVNYKALNTYTLADCFPLPRIDHALSLLQGARYISTLDANKGFHQLCLNENSIEPTAFSTHHGLWEWTRVPMGIRNAPPFFQRVVNEMFEKEIKEGWLIAYIDDLIIFSNSYEEHIEHLSRVLRICKEANFTLSPKKCKFAFTT